MGDKDARRAKTRRQAADGCVNGIVFEAGGLIALERNGRRVFAVTFGGRLPIRLGRLPGDIAIHGKNSSFYFPMTTCILLSALLSLLLCVFRR